MKNRKIIWLLYWVARQFLVLALLISCNVTRDSVGLPISTPTELSPAAAATAVPASPTSPTGASTPTEITLPPGETEAATTPASPEPTEGTVIPGDQPVIEPETADNLEPVAELNESGASNFSWLPGSEALAVATEGEVVVYEVEPEQPPAETQQIDVEQPSMLTTSPDEQVLAWTDEQNIVALYNIPQQTVVAEEPNDASVTALAFSPQGDALASASYDNLVKVLDADTGQVMLSWEVPGWLSDLSFSPDGALLGGVDLPNFRVHIFDAATGIELRTLEWTETSSPALYRAVFSPDWQTIAWVARGTVQLMEVESGSLGPVFSHEDAVSDLVWSPDGRLLATSAAATVNDVFGPVVILWDAASGQPMSTLALPEPTNSLSFSPDGTQLATLYSSGELQFWAVTQP